MLDMLGRSISIGERVVLMTGTRSTGTRPYILTVNDITDKGILAFRRDVPVVSAMRLREDEIETAEPVVTWRMIEDSKRVVRLPFTETDRIVLMLNEYYPIGADHEHVAETATQPPFSTRPDLTATVRDFSGRLLKKGDLLLYKIYSKRLAIGVLEHLDYTKRLIIRPKLVDGSRIISRGEHNISPSDSLLLPLEDDVLASIT